MLRISCVSACLVAPLCWAMTGRNRRAGLAVVVAVIAAMMR
jgi:hypothetical protein